MSVETVYLVHHSHTDIGYTHDQPILWELQSRFIDAALDLCEQSTDDDADHAFRWTVETTGVLMNWMRTSSDRQIERFVRLARAGRIEVTAMLANLTPLCDVDALIESFAPIRTVRDSLGLPVRSAMNTDVNGQNWPLVDILLDLGISGFTMAINAAFGGALAGPPYAFHWEGPSGRSILAWNGWNYGLGWQVGIGRDADAFARKGWPAIQRWLAERSYPLPILMIQVLDAFGDNGPGAPPLPGFVHAWNAEGRSPRLRIALPHEWWDAVATYSDRLPRLRGDWTDFWNFGCASSAREQAINRASRGRLFTADAAHATVAALNPLNPLPESVDSPRDYHRRYADLRQQAIHALSFWDEHTWGADLSADHPDNDDALTQWGHKASYAYTGRSLSTLLARDGAAELARQVQRRPTDRLLIFNPLPWPRTVAGPVPDPEKPRGRPDDHTASRHFQDRAVPSASRMLKPTVVPPFGYAVVGADSFAETDGQAAVASARSDELTVENQRFRVAFDGTHGGITSLLDLRLNRELVDRTAGLPFFGFVHEALADRRVSSPRDLFWDLPTDPLLTTRGWKPDWPAERQTAGRVLEHRLERGPLGIRVIQRLEAVGVGNLVQEVFLPAFADQIECTGAWDMTLETRPEATYLAFPFSIEGAEARLDLGGQACVLGREQLPGACYDYFTAQRWVELGNAEWGVTVATPDAPMIQLGGFHFAANLQHFELSRPLLLGWVTNNYWSTNFRAHQPGRVSARYVIRPHAGAFDESAAHRFGAEVAVPVVFQHLGEPPVTEPRFPTGAGTILHLPDDPVVTLRVKPSADGGGTIVRLLNASDRPVDGAIRPGLLVVRAATRCDLLEHPLESLATDGDAVRLTLPARGIACVRLELGLRDIPDAAASTLTLPSPCQGEEGLFLSPAGRG